MQKVTEMLKKKLTYSEKLENIRGLFRQAYNSTLTLNEEMNKDIVSKEQTIKSLEDNIKEIKVTQEENKVFMANLKSFLGKNEEKVSPENVHTSASENLL